MIVDPNNVDNLEDVDETVQYPFTALVVIIFSNYLCGFQCLS